MSKECEGFISFIKGTIGDIEELLETAYELARDIYENTEDITYYMISEELVDYILV
ncbi:MAG: hypothetical protein ACRDD7_03510 [Peptostreptococcaceae bacterium]